LSASVAFTECVVYDDTCWITQLDMR